MNIKELMNLIERSRIAKGLHKSTLCKGAEISATYYNQLLEGGKNPSIGVVMALLDGVGLGLRVVSLNNLDMMMCL